MFLSRSGLDLSKIAAEQSRLVESDERIEQLRRDASTGGEDETRAYLAALRRSGRDDEANHAEFTEPYQRLAKARKEANQAFWDIKGPRGGGFSTHAKEQRYRARKERAGQAAKAAQARVHDLLKRLHAHDPHHGGRLLKPYDGQHPTDHLHDLASHAQPDIYPDRHHRHNHYQDQEVDGDGTGEGNAYMDHEHTAQAFQRSIQHHYPDGSSEIESDPGGHMVWYNHKGPMAQ